MVEKISLDGIVLNANKRKFQRELQQPRFRLYDIIRSRDSSSTGSVEATAAWNSVENFLATYKTLNDIIQENGHLGEDYRLKKEFALVFSIYSGAAIGFSELQHFRTNSGQVLNKHELDFSRGDYCMREDLLQTLVSSLGSAKDEKGALAIAKDFFSWVLLESKNAAAQEKFRDLNHQAKEMHIHVNGITINGFSFKESAEVSYETDFSEIVGNKQMVAALKRGLEIILSYRADEKTNVLNEFSDFPQKFIVDGKPGTGKTHTLKALAGYGQRIAEENSIDFRVVNITNAIKSEFYGVSARNLREELSQVHKGDAVYLVIIEDIDTIFYSRNELKNRPEDKSVLGELMNQLEGIATSALGNYMIVSTTNHPLNLDIALAERLSEKTLHSTGPETETDYVDLFKIKLKKGIGNYIGIAEREWQEIGKKCMEYGFSGRAIKNICLQSLDECNDFEKPESWYCLPVEEQRRIAPNLFKKINGRSLLEKIEQYRMDGIRKEQEGHEKRLGELVCQIKLQEEAYAMKDGAAKEG